MTKPSPRRRHSDPSTEADQQQPINLRGLKYFAMLRPLLAELRSEGTARDKAGNRTPR